jgi:hexosaminidase
MDVRQVKYARAMFDPVFSVKKDEKGQLVVELSSEVDGLDIHYSWDNSHPDQYYPRYSTPMTVPKEASMLKAVTYRQGRQVGRQIDMPVKELEKRAGNGK